MPAQAVLLELTDVAPEMESEFAGWYEEVFAPAVLKVPGVLKARRYRAVLGQPKYLALLELADGEVVQTPEFLEVQPWGPEARPAASKLYASCGNTTRALYRHLITLPEVEPADLSGARGLLITGLEPDEAHDEEFQDWYNTEHLPSLAAADGSFRAQRYKVNSEWPGTVGTPVIFIGLYDLVGPEVVSTDDWKRRASSPWSDRIRRYRTLKLRNVYERVYP